MIMDAKDQDIERIEQILAESPRLSPSRDLVAAAINDVYERRRIAWYRPLLAAAAVILAISFWMLGSDGYEPPTNDAIEARIIATELDMKQVRSPDYSVVTYDNRQGVDRRIERVKKKALELKKKLEFTTWQMETGALTKKGEGYV